MKIGNRKGFSLIEIGIVMVVIGLIIAAVMKGKDVIKGAEVKESTQNYMSKWINAMDVYYDKLGYNYAGSASLRAIKEFTTSSAPVRCTDELNVTTPNSLDELFTSAGMNINQLIKTNTNDVCTQTMSGEFTQDAIVGANFAYITVDGQAKNAIIYTHVPVDVAKTFDKMVDSVIDGTRGRVTFANENSNGEASVLSANTEKAVLTATTFTSAAWPTVEQEKVVDVVVTLEH
ncbi:MAG: type II secretion system protein [Campylobacterota bacterium]|nr:type II secretion system protein [Campylobacterota bacterium]